MCVIIVKNPGIELPFDKLASACKVNADGYGISFLDRGKMETRKAYVPEGNKPEEVAKILEEGKDLQTIVHLRYRTAGEKHLDACHPFPVLTKEVHGEDMLLMHNGTMDSFRKTGAVEPDSYFFATTRVRPLMEKFAAGMSYSEVLDDPFFKQVIEDYAGTRNKIVVYNEHGKVLIVNRDQGKEFEGWWASNEYSFNQYHRTPVSTVGNGASPGQGSTIWANGYGATPKTTVTELVKPNSGVPILPAHAPNSSATSVGKSASIVCLPTKEGREVAGVIKANAATPNKLQIIPPNKRDTFVEITGLATLEQATMLEEDDIYDLVKELPDVATTLIMDLLYEVYLKPDSKKMSA